MKTPEETQIRSINRVVIKPVNSLTDFLSCDITSGHRTKSESRQFEAVGSGPVVHSQESLTGNRVRLTCSANGLSAKPGLGLRPSGRPPPVRSRRSSRPRWRPVRSSALPSPPPCTPTRQRCRTDSERPGPSLHLAPPPALDFLLRLKQDDKQDVY